MNPDCSRDIPVSPNQKEPIPDGGKGESIAFRTPCVFFIETSHNPNSRTFRTCPSLTNGTRCPGRTTLVPTPASRRRWEVSSTFRDGPRGFLTGRTVNDRNTWKGLEACVSLCCLRVVHVKTCLGKQSWAKAVSGGSSGS